MKAGKAQCWVVVLVLAAGCSAIAEEGRYESARGWYLGGLFGTTSIEIPNQNIKMEGIEFNAINADDSDMGTYVYTGYWISPYVGFEIGYNDLGSVEAMFDYHDPRSGERGTGESDVGMAGGTYTLQLAYDIKQVKVFAKAGLMTWSTDYETRFDADDGETVRREFSEEGAGMIVGAGASWNFKGGWNLRADASLIDVDIADVQFFSIGLEYDFSRLFRAETRRSSSFEQAWFRD